MAWKPSSLPGPIVCGHRGAAAVEPENTIASFQAAVDRGATWVEFDVRPAGDGSLVIHHDPDTSAGKNVATSSRQELDSSIPLFADLAQAQPGLGLDLEMKTDDIGMTLDRFVGLVVDDVDEYVKDLNNLIVTSFDAEALAIFHERRPDIATGLLFHDKSGDWAIETAVQNGHIAIAPWYKLVSPELVTQAKAADLAVATWTVNSPKVVRAVIEAGVDMIIGDDPSVICETLEELRVAKGE